MEMDLAPFTFQPRNKMLYDNGARYDDIRDFTGIKTKKSLDGKIRPHEAELASVMNNLFRNL
jgi:hypothetical protein